MEPVNTHHKVFSEAQDFRVFEAEEPASFSLHELRAELLNGNEPMSLNEELFESDPERFCDLFDAYCMLLKEQGTFYDQAQRICCLVKDQIIFCKNSKLRERFVAVMQDQIWQSQLGLLSSTAASGFHIACMPPEERVKAVQHLYNQQRIWEKDLIRFVNDLICYIGALEGPIKGEENDALCKLLAKWLLEKGYKSHPYTAEANGMQRLLNIFTADFRFKEYDCLKRQNPAAGLLVASGYQAVQSNEFLDALAYAWCRDSSISKPASSKIAANAINELLSYIEPREEDLILLFTNGGYTFKMTINSRKKLIQQFVNDPIQAEEILRMFLKKDEFNKFESSFLLYAITGVDLYEHVWTINQHEYFIEVLPQEALERAGSFVSKKLYISNEIKMRVAKRLPLEQALPIIDSLSKPVASYANSFSNSLVCDFVEICQNLDLATTEKIQSHLDEPERRRAWLYLALGGTKEHQEYAAMLFEREPLGRLVSSRPDNGPKLLKSPDPDILIRIAKSLHSSLVHYDEHSQKIITEWVMAASVYHRTTVDSPKTMNDDRVQAAVLALFAAPNDIERNIERLSHQIGKDALESALHKIAKVSRPHLFFAALNDAGQPTGMTRLSNLQELLSNALRKALPNYEEITEVVSINDAINLASEAMAVETGNRNQVIYLHGFPDTRGDASIAAKDNRVLASWEQWTPDQLYPNQPFWKPLYDRVAGWKNKFGNYDLLKGLIVVPHRTHTRAPSKYLELLRDHAKILQLGIAVWEPGHRKGKPYFSCSAGKLQILNPEYIIFGDDDLGCCGLLARKDRLDLEAGTHLGIIKFVNALRAQLKTTTAAVTVVGEPVAISRTVGILTNDGESDGSFGPCPIPLDLLRRVSVAATKKLQSVHTNSEDGIRDWGVHLNIGDPAEFNEINYLQLITRWAEGSSFGSEEIAKLVVMHSKTSAAFGLGTPVAYAGSGSDIMQVVFDLSRNYALAAGRNPGPSDYTVAYFGYQYGASRFAGSGINFLNFVQNPTKLNDFYVGNAHSRLVTPTDKVNKELSWIKNREDDAIEKLKALVKERAIGAVVLENIAGAAGCLFVRPEFRKRLREVCTELNILLVADETLMAFRTGYPYSFQTEDYLCPDVVMIGKGFGVAALMAYGMDAEKVKTYLNNPQEQLKIPPTMLARSLLVLHTLQSRNTLAYIRETAPQVHELLRQAQRDQHVDEYVEGIGFAIGMNTLRRTRITQINKKYHEYSERLLLPLDITIDQLKSLLQ